MTRPLQVHCHQRARPVVADTAFTAFARSRRAATPIEGQKKIRWGEQADYDLAHWSSRSRPIDALPIHERWIYGIAHVDAATTAHADGATKSFSATKTWLLQRQDSGGEWLIARQMWNLK